MILQSKELPVIQTAWSSVADTRMAAREVCQQLFSYFDDKLPQLLLIHYTSNYQAILISEEIKACFGSVPCVGISSYAGAITEEGLHQKNQRCIAMWAIHDPVGAYHVESLDFNGDLDLLSGVQSALKDALLNAGRPGEIPPLILMYSSTGYEEEVINSLQQVVGVNVPIFGGSAVNSPFLHNNTLFDQCRSYSEGLAIAVLFPSVELYYDLHLDIKTTSLTGEVTLAEERTLLEIDYEPASTVYNEWTYGLLTSAKNEDSESAIFSKLATNPLGCKTNITDELPIHTPILIRSVNEDGSLELLSNIAIGDQINLYTVTTELIADNMCQSFLSALGKSDSSMNDIIGGISFCSAGRVLPLQEETSDNMQSLLSDMQGFPFIGLVSVAEQGRFQDGVTRHTQLANSVILFTSKLRCIL
jgi:hypothetical protein